MAFKINKASVFELFYTLQAGFGSTGWLFSILAYNSIFILTLKSIYPTFNVTVISFITPMVAIIVLLAFGRVFLKVGGYKAQQTFGGKNNPARINWETTLRTINMDIAMVKTMIQLAQKNNLPTYDLDDNLFELTTYKKNIEELLGE